MEQIFVNQTLINYDCLKNLSIVTIIYNDCALNFDIFLYCFQ